MQHLLQSFACAFASKPYILEAIGSWPFLDPRSCDMTSLKHNFLKKFSTDSTEVLYECVKLMLNRVLYVLRPYLHSFLSSWESSLGWGALWAPLANGGLRLNTLPTRSYYSQPPTPKLNHNTTDRRSIPEKLSNRHGIYPARRCWLTAGSSRRLLSTNWYPNVETGNCEDTMFAFANKLNTVCAQIQWIKYLMSRCFVKFQSMKLMTARLGFHWKKWLYQHGSLTGERCRGG